MSGSKADLVVVSYRGSYSSFTFVSDEFDIDLFSSHIDLFLDVLSSKKFLFDI